MANPDPRLCRYLGHAWPSERHYVPVHRPLPAPTWEAEEVDIRPVKIEAYAEQLCRRRCGAYRVLDYDGNVVKEKA